MTATTAIARARAGPVGADPEVLCGDERVRAAARMLLRRERSRTELLTAIQTLAAAALEGLPDGARRAPLVLPLRSGVAFIPPLLSRLEHSSVHLASSRAVDGERAMREFEWVGQPVPRTARTVVLADVIAATGRTISATRELIWRSLDEAPALFVVVCYGSPQALRLIEALPRVEGVVLACLGETVDRSGLVQPPTHGDIGDQLFATRPPSLPAFRPARGRVGDGPTCAAPLPNPSTDGACSC